MVSRIELLPAAPTHTFSHRAFDPYGYQHHIVMALLKREEAFDLYRQPHGLTDTVAQDESPATFN